MGLDNPLHIAFLLIMVLLVFGAKRLPEMGKSLGHGMRGFKDAIGGESPPVALATPTSPLEQSHAVSAQVEQPQAVSAQVEPPQAVATPVEQQPHTETSIQRVAA